MKSGAEGSERHSVGSAFALQIGCFISSCQRCMLRKPDVEKVLSVNELASAAVFSDQSEADRMHAIVARSTADAWEQRELHGSGESGLAAT